MINPIRFCKIGLATVALTSAVMFSQQAFSRTKTEPDTFENTVTPKGVSDKSELKNAPSP